MSSATSAVHRALDRTTAKLIIVKSLNVTHLNQEQKEQLADKLRSHIERVKEQKDPNIIRYISVDIDKEINNTVSILME